MKNANSTVKKNVYLTVNCINRSNDELETIHFIFKTQAQAKRTKRLIEAMQLPGFQSADVSSYSESYDSVEGALKRVFTTCMGIEV